MLLHFCPVGVTLSWEEAPPGARASRPHKSSRSFGHLLHRNQPAAAPCLCFGRAHAVPAGRAVGCNIAGKLSGNRRDSMRAGRPRSRGCRPDGEVGGIRRATSLKAGLSPLGNSRLPASRAPAPPRLGRSIEKDYKLNIDAQDAQDNQDGRLLQETLTRAMIVCGFEDVREHKPAVSEKNPVHPVHRCESKIYPCLTMNRFPATRRRRLFQASRAPAPQDGADHSRVKQVLFQTRQADGTPAQIGDFLCHQPAQTKTSATNWTSAVLQPWP